MKAKYTWVITQDKILGDSSDAVGKVGPSGAKERARFDVVIREGEHFRLLNQYGKAEFSGYILGDYTGAEPLEDFGRENGCTDLEYESDGKWVASDGTVRGSAQP